MQVPSAVDVDSKIAPRQLPRWAGTWGVVALWTVLLALRLTGPPNLADGYHQERAAAYVLDALRNGNWICQYGMYGEVSSKPPMFTWLAALASLPFGQANWFTLILPGAVLTLGIATLLFRCGDEFFGRTAGFLAAVTYLMSPVGMKQIVLARIDGVFAFTVMLAALLGFRAWQTGRGWSWFWLGAAMSTLTKGPLGVLLGGFGLLAVIWERRQGFQTRLSGSHWLGIAMFWIITFGWFGLAYWKMGQPLIDVMVGDELVGHAVQEKGKLPGQLAYLPTLYFLGRFAPWSVLAFGGFWRIWKRPAQIESERRFERFLFCWFFAGLALFSLSPHQRPDLIFPLLPAAALVGGRELARVLEWKRIPIAAATAVIVVIGLGSAFAKYHVTEQKDNQVLETAALKNIAAKIKTAGQGEFPLMHVDSSFALQFYLNTKRPLVPVHMVAEILKQKPAAFVAVSDLGKLQQELGSDSNRMHTLAEWNGRRDACYIVSNHPRLEWTEEMATVIGPALLTLNHVQSMRSTANNLRFTATAKGASLIVQPAWSQALRVQRLDERGAVSEEKILKPGEQWRIEVSEAAAIRLSTPETRNRVSARPT
jgi:4-amino-4-deoxy-L-arabinose transferase-like glycosyltransferase